MSSLSWFGETLCHPNCLVKSDIKALFVRYHLSTQNSRAPMRAYGQIFFFGLHVAHVCIICPVCDVTYVRKCTSPSPAFPYCKRRKAGRGLGTRLQLNCSYFQLLMYKMKDNISMSQAAPHIVLLSVNEYRYWF